MALPPDLPALLRRAGEKRAHLPERGTTIYRAAHLTETDGVFTLERAGDAGVLSLYRDLSAEEEARLAASCGEVLKLESISLKRRPPEARHLANVAREQLSPPRPAWGPETAEVMAFENGVPFLIRPSGDLSIGLFSDMRPARAWLRERAPELGAVLNTFAYTCGFGLMARLGGAAAKNLDASRKVLSWGRENYALSKLPAPEEDFIFGDVFDWLGRFARRGARFGAVILDPPSFARGKDGTWSAARDYARLARLAANVVAEGGLLLACLNHAGVSAVAFERMVFEGLRETAWRGEIEARLGAGEDYPGASHLKVLAVRLLD